MVKSFRKELLSVLLESAAENDKLIILNADSARALQVSEFEKQYPDRILNMGISEADMMSAAAGLAATGLTPVVVGFAMFVAEKPFEQIRQSIAYPNLNVKIIATHGGLCVGQDGATHQALEDIALMRTLPNFKVFVAADVQEERALVKEMLKHEGPAFLRLGRDLAPDIFGKDKTVMPGGSDILAEGEDLSIIACGLMVQKALEAADILRKEGIFASVVNMYSLKPLDAERIKEQAMKTGAIVSAEDHSVIGGLGSAIAEIISETCPVPLKRVGVEDVFGESGTQEALYSKYGLTAENIAEKARQVVRMKQSERQVYG